VLNQLKTVVLLGALSAILIGLGGYLAPGYLYVFIGISILLNFGAYFWSDRIVLRMQGAREVAPHEAPRLHAMVDDLAARVEIPKPRVYIVPETQPNAFATGRNPAHAAVAVTEGILSLLSERELYGVLAHELAHIKHRDVLIATIAAAIASTVAYLANIMQFTAIFGGISDDDEGGSPLAALGLAIVAPLAATLVQLGISRSREYHADATGAEISGDPEALASALAKLQNASERIRPAVQPAIASLFIVNPFAGGRALVRLFSTHPPMEERIARLRQMQVKRRLAYGWR
jgi:heat shock protein HtpX